MAYCIKCGSTTKKLLYHHEKYIEITGQDRVVLMCYSCHKTLHDKLRKEGRCKISVKELYKISMAARDRRPGMKDNQRQYWQSYRQKHQEEIKTYRKKYCYDNHNNIQKKDKQYRKNHRKEAREYQKQNIYNIIFDKGMMPYVRLYEYMTYNYNTGNIYISSYFRGSRGKKLFYIDIGD